MVMCLRTPFSNFQVSATDKNFLTISHCVFTSSHYRYRCQWERNQILNVCVSQSSRSVWVPSRGQLCSFPSPPSQPPLSSWSTAVYREAIALCHRCKTIALFLHALRSFINESHCCLKAWCWFMNRLYSWIRHVEVCCCTCAHIDQDRSDCTCEAQSCKCGDTCSCSMPIYM